MVLHKELGVNPCAATYYLSNFEQHIFLNFRFLICKIGCCVGLISKVKCEAQ